jgi:cytochrome c
MKAVGWTDLMTLSATLYIVSSFSPVAQDIVSAGAGQQLFNNACRTCHSIRDGDNRLGPNLHRIVGRKAGSLPDYNYSSAMRDADFVWDEAKLARFICNPDEVVPGNKMAPYSGVASAADAIKIVVFLSSLRTQ